jgi:hypothetical protein
MSRTIQTREYSVICVILRTDALTTSRSGPKGTSGFGKGQYHKRRPPTEAALFLVVVLLWLLLLLGRLLCLRIYLRGRRLIFFIGQLLPSLSHFQK